jgi:hypothetical protein
MRAALATLAFALVAACASDPGAPSATRTTPSGTSSSRAPSTGGGTGTAAATTTATPSSATTGTTPAPLGTSSGGRVVLAKGCVHRGDATDQQNLTVTAGTGETVTYSTYYSDYSTELNRPDYTTGHGYGQAGPDGRYRVSWVVPAQATPGRATVRVTAGDMEEDAQEASFIVVKQGERCP